MQVFHTVNRRYAERFGEKWYILSAKHGFIDPGCDLPGPYNVTFKRKSSGPVAAAKLKQQVEQLGLDRFPVVVGLGGKEYRQAIETAFAGTPVELRFPFAGLPIGKAMQAINKTIEAGAPFLTQNSPESSSEICTTLYEWFRQAPAVAKPVTNRNTKLPTPILFLKFNRVIVLLAFSV